MKEDARVLIQLLNRIIVLLVLVCLFVGIVKWVFVQQMHAEMALQYTRITSLQKQAADIIALAAETSIMQKNITENVESRMLRIEALQSDIVQNMDKISQHIVPTK